MKKASRDTEVRLYYSPWHFFLLFTVISAVLSYAPLSLTLKSFLGLFGIVAPFILALTALSKSRSPKPPLDQQETFPPVGTVIFLLCILGAASLRFSALTTWPLWPNTDEGLLGRFAQDLSRHWNGRFFYTFGQAPPGFIWILSWLVPWFQNPLKAFWLVPGVFSLGACLLSYWAARAFFSRSLSFLVFLLWCFSFWPLFYGRFCHMGASLPLWTCLVLGVLGRLLKARPGQGQGWAVALGAALAVGSFTFTPWPAFALWGCGVFLWSWIRSKEKGKVLIGFALAYGIVLIPFLSAVMTEGFGQHIYGVSSVRGYVPLSGQLIAFFSYLTGPFWGVFEDQAAYAPIWGGFLNPLLTGAFFIGFLESFVSRSRWEVRAAWAGGVLCLLPGLLSMNVEMYRVIPILPFLLLGAALGLQRLLTLQPSSRRWGILALLLILSTGLDLAQLWRPWLFPPKVFLGSLPGVYPAKPTNSYQAYRLLEQMSQEGPGLFFNDFSVEPYDQTVGVGVYGFNALVNPKLSMDSAKWAAFIVNVNYQPFLAKQFPRGRWFWLDEMAGEANGGLMLGIIPVTPENKGTFGKWAKIHDSFQKLDWDWLNLADGMKGEPYLPDLQPAKYLLAGEPFLTALYWEKIAGLLYRDRAYPKDAQALQKALGEGVPAAHLYYKLGSILLRKNRFQEARSFLEKAATRPFNRTRSQEALQMLDEIEKQGGLPPS